MNRAGLLYPAWPPTYSSTLCQGTRITSAQHAKGGEAKKGGSESDISTHYDESLHWRNGDHTAAVQKNCVAPSKGAFFLCFNNTVLQVGGSYCKVQTRGREGQKREEEGPLPVDEEGRRKRTLALLILPPVLCVVQLWVGKSAPPPPLCRNIFLSILYRADGGGGRPPSTVLERRRHTQYGRVPSPLSQRATYSERPLSARRGGELRAAPSTTTCTRAEGRRGTWGRCYGGSSLLYWLVGWLVGEREGSSKGQN